ncbi:MAG: GNAT family N-acetyltransferase [Leptothrix sp. (in: b-proteobacteria)]
MPSHLVWPELEAREPHVVPERGEVRELNQPAAPMPLHGPPSPVQRPVAELLGLYPESAGLLPMQHPAWVISCVTTFVTHSQLTLLAAGDQPLRRALAPLWCSGPGRWSHLELLGSAQTGEPSDLLWSDETALQALADQLARQRLAIKLNRVPADSPTLPALRRAFHGRGLMLVREAQGTPTLALDPSWLWPNDKFNAGRRSDFRRAERHAERLGGLSFELHEQLSEQELDRLLDEAYAVEARSWKGASGSAMLHDPMRGAFFRRYAHAAMRSGMLRLALMRIGGLAVGMQIAVEWQDRFWLLKIGYDAAYSKCSPGLLLMLHTVQHAAERGLKSYEFLGSPAPWTSLWTRTLRPCVRVLAYPASVPGAVSLAGDLLQTLRQRFAARRSQP